MDSYRFEIVANQSVEDDIVETLEENISDIEYTVIPTVHGRGRSSKKLGTTTWPEQNFLLFAYVSEETARKMKTVLEAVQKKFPREGISFFCVKAAEL